MEKSQPTRVVSRVRCAVAAAVLILAVAPIVRAAQTTQKELDMAPGLSHQHPDLYPVEHVHIMAFLP